MKVIEFEEKYRDDLIFMVLEAKDHINRVPRINDDLLDIKSNYYDKGDKFWLAIDENDRVIGCIGIKTVSIEEIWLKSFYIKYNLKNNGIGTKMLNVVLEYVKSIGGFNIYTQFSSDYKEAQIFYPRKGFKEVAPYKMVKSVK